MRTSGTTTAADDDFIDGLYRREAGALVGLIHSYCRDRAVAEEIVQESFVRLRFSLDRLQDRAQAASYLRSIAFNLARSGFRRQAVADRYRPEEQRPCASPEETYVLREDQRAVVAALGRLSEKQRACLVLRYYDDLSEREIASILGLSPNSVKTHVRRGMDALSRILGVTT